MMGTMCSGGKKESYWRQRKAGREEEMINKGGGGDETAKFRIMQGKYIRGGQKDLKKKNVIIGTLKNK